MKVGEIPDVSPEPFDGKGRRGIEFDGYRVLEWVPPDGDDPTEVHILFEVKDAPIIFALRLKSADAVDRHIAILQRHRNNVWGSDAT